MIVRMEVYTASQTGTIKTATQELVQDNLEPKFQSELSCHQAPASRIGNKVLQTFSGASKVMLWLRRASGQLLSYIVGMAYDLLHLQLPR